jgi:hypothetical protein
MRFRSACIPKYPAERGTHGIDSLRFHTACETVRHVYVNGLASVYRVKFKAMAAKPPLRLCINIFITQLFM